MVVWSVTVVGGTMIVASGLVEDVAAGSPEVEGAATVVVAPPGGWVPAGPAVVVGLAVVAVGRAVVVVAGLAVVVVFPPPPPLDATVTWPAIPTPLALPCTGQK